MESSECFDKTLITDILWLEAFYTEKYIESILYHIKP